MDDFAWFQTDSVKWHISHLNSTVSPSELKNEGLTLLRNPATKTPNVSSSSFSSASTASSAANRITEVKENFYCGKDLQYAFRSYRLLFVVDASRSSLGFDTASMTMPIRSLFRSVNICLQALLRPWHITPAPKIYVSIVAHDTTQHPFKVLLQSCLLTQELLPEIITELHARFAGLEKEITGRQRKQTHMNYNESYGSMGSLLQHGLFTMDRMPLAACPLMFLLTDGVGSLTGYHRIMGEFVSRGVSCSIIQSHVNNFVPHTALGYVPDPSMLAMIAERTGGVYYTQSAINEMEQMINILKTSNTEDIERGEGRWGRRKHGFGHDMTDKYDDISNGCDSLIFTVQACHWLRPSMLHTHTHTHTHPTDETHQHLTTHSHCHPHSAQTPIPRQSSITPQIVRRKGVPSKVSPGHLLAHAPIEYVSLSLIYI